jgi:hypothetical protein
VADLKTSISGLLAGALGILAYFVPATAPYAVPAMAIAVILLGIFAKDEEEPKVEAKNG